MANQNVFDETFLSAYCDFCKKFDELDTDKFNGPVLDELTTEFRQQHSDYIQKLTDQAGIEPIASGSDAHIEDFEILSKECSQIEGITKEHSQEFFNRVISSNDPKILLSDLYRRACEASHLRSTFNKGRKKQEDDRLEPVIFGRLAIRYDEDSVYAISWFAMSLGWYLDPYPNSLERATIGRNLRLACERCIKMNPDNWICHYLLGRYYYNIAKLNWIQKRAVATVLGFKLTGNFDDAKHHLLLTMKAIPSYGPACLFMARILSEEKGSMDEIKRWIDSGINYVPSAPAAEMERENLLELRSKLKLQTS